MADPFVAEIRIFGFNFAPKGWAFCDGQILPISQNTALFSLLGTIYGGDGRSTFALPNLQGSAPMFWGQGPGLSLYDIGQTGGEDTVTLLTSEMPQHTHNARAQTVDPGDTRIPAPQLNLGSGATGAIYTSGNPTGVMDPTATSLYGNGQPHNNLQPYLTLNLCIALQGVYPPRT
jgi:microcystin-dependent protein